MRKYSNEMLNLPKVEIKKEWDNLWDKLFSLDPIRDANEIVEVKKRFDKCEEAYYAIDCGTYWNVKRASDLRKGINGTTFKVMKES